MKGPFIIAAGPSAGRQSMLAVCTVVLMVMLSAGSSIGNDDDATRPTDGSREMENPGPKSSGPSENTVVGYILQATPDAARTFSAQSMHEISHYRLTAVAPRAPFEVRSLETASESCLAGQCVETPDFDIAFFKQRADGSASVVQRAYGVGSPEGVVPDSATFAHVYLRTPGSELDGFDGYGFVYLQGNPGKDAVPDWPPEGSPPK